ncbi:hypothetical protein DV515_00001917 [Chloebia gouldiae]|uniref:Uncharacterized protein n=1 Tax=Chloebia gouldiae TaxID=44316 RepID=A0A3L8SXB9_CHLGU|nr:hypothetical protein DV515_00001917 [Chloebia gouldiae]
MPAPEGAGRTYGEEWLNSPPEADFLSVPEVSIIQVFNKSEGRMHLTFTPDGTFLADMGIPQKRQREYCMVRIKERTDGYAVSVIILPLAQQLQQQYLSYLLLLSY